MSTKYGHQVIPAARNNDLRPTEQVGLDVASESWREISLHHIILTKPHKLLQNVSHVGNQYGIAYNNFTNYIFPLSFKHAVYNALCKCKVINQSTKQSVWLSSNLLNDDCCLSDWMFKCMVPSGVVYVKYRRHKCNDMACNNFHQVSTL